MSEPVASRALFTRLPQAVFAFAAAGALLVHFIIGPLPFPDWPWLQLLGAVIAALGVNFMIAAAIAMSQRKTSPLPWRHSDAIVFHGVYRFSRNPIYLGDVMLLAGLGLWFNVGWLVLAAVLAVPATTRLVIVHEEAYMAERFPEIWPGYRANVRRWL